jgi:hypothetical protein
LNILKKSIKMHAVIPGIKKMVKMHPAIKMQTIASREYDIVVVVAARARAGGDNVEDSHIRWGE